MNLPDFSGVIEKGDFPPRIHKKIIMVRSAGFEPATSGTANQRSIQLSYERAQNIRYKKQRLFYLISPDS